MYALRLKRLGGGSQSQTLRRCTIQRIYTHQICRGDNLRTSKICRGMRVYTNPPRRRFSRASTLPPYTFASFNHLFQLTALYYTIFRGRFQYPSPKNLQKPLPQIRRAPTKKSSRPCLKTAAPIAPPPASMAELCSAKLSCAKSASFWYHPAHHPRKNLYVLYVLHG